MKAREYLARKKHQLFTCRPEDTIEVAAAMLAKHNIGALPVVDSTGALAGIISERDIIRAIVSKGFQIQKVNVAQLMTRNVATCGLNDSVMSTRDIMKAHNCRHVPIVDGGKLLGIISVRDTLECKLEQRELEMNVLRDNVIAARNR